MKERLLAGLAALVLAAAPGRAAADDYVYTDDFSTPQCQTDSYAHHPIVTGVPSSLPDRFLWLNGGVLQFYVIGYAEPGVNDAEIAYKFPICQSTTGILGGTLDLDAVTYLWCPLGETNHLEIETSPDGLTWTTRYEATDDWGLQHVHIELPDVGARNAYVKVRALAMQIDNLDVRLQTDTLVGTDQPTWSAVKALYKE